MRRNQLEELNALLEYRSSRYAAALRICGENPSDPYRRHMLLKMKSDILLTGLGIAILTGLMRAENEV